MSVKHLSRLSSAGDPHDSHAAPCHGCAAGQRCEEGESPGLE